MTNPRSAASRGGEPVSEMEVLLRRIGDLARGVGAEGALVGPGDLARSLYQERAVRHSYLTEQLLGEPAWDILLDLFASEHEGREISVTSACIASCAPPTTGLRYLARLESAGLVERSAAAGDRRRWNLGLSPAGRAAMEGALSRIAGQRSLLLGRSEAASRSFQTLQAEQAFESVAASETLYSCGK